MGNKTDKKKTKFVAFQKVSCTIVGLQKLHRLLGLSGVVAIFLLLFATGSPLTQGVEFASRNFCFVVLVGVVVIHTWVPIF